MNANPTQGSIAGTEILPAAVNYHLNRHCNFSCRYCFAAFNDHPTSHGVMLPRGDMFQIVSEIAAAPPPKGAPRRKLTFVGGEPTLCPWLPELIAYAKEEGLVTMLVTNGSRLDEAYLNRLGGALDWVSISVDSADADTNRRIGRHDAAGPMMSDAYVQLAELVRASGMRLKVNTVVNALNCVEDMSVLIVAMMPERWKVLQAMPVAGQNDEFIGDLQVEQRWFDAFVRRHALASEFDITVIPESIEDMRGSYAMIDPYGRFFDSASGRHFYSNSILEVGVSAAFREVTFDRAKFHRRGGDYQYTPDSDQRLANAA